MIDDQKTEAPIPVPLSKHQLHTCEKSTTGLSAQGADGGQTHFVAMGSFGLATKVAPRVMSHTLDRLTTRV